jgi:hypothetical protein
VTTRVAVLRSNSCVLNRRSASWAGMHISPSQSDHAEDEAREHSLIPEGDDEAERECLDGGRRALSCHADQGKVHTYRVKIVEHMWAEGVRGDAHSKRLGFRV